MAKSNRDDNRNFIITSKYKHKSTKLSNFVEKEVVDRFESYQLSETSSQVENRKEARKWLEKVKNTALEAMSNISQYRKDGKNPPDFDALIEEERLKVLHEIGWSYTDNFITRKKNKKNPTDTSTSDPETSFMISTEEIGNILYYRASYGIVRGVANKSIGNYTYTLTLDDAIRFIRREFETSGKTAMSRKLLEAKKRQLKMERSDRRLNGNSLNQEVEEELDKVWNTNNINKVIKRIQDSADITTVADFIEFFLAPIARKMHYEAFKHEKELQGAQRIQDRNMVDLDKPESPAQEEQVVRLKPTTRTNNEGVEEKRFVPADTNRTSPTPRRELEESAYTPAPSKSEKTTASRPSVPESPESIKKSIKNSERVQIKKPLLPPVPSLPLINEEQGVDIDETTNQVDETLDIDHVSPSIEQPDNVVKDEDVKNLENADDEVEATSTEETPVEETQVEETPIEETVTEDESGRSTKDSNITAINTSFPEFVDTSNVVVEENEDIEEEPESTNGSIRDLIADTIIIDDEDGSVAQQIIQDVEEDNIPDEDEIRNDFVDGNSDGEKLQEEVSVDIVEKDYLQPEDVVQELEDEESETPEDEEVTEFVVEDEVIYPEDDKEPANLPSEDDEVDEEVVEVESEPRINDDIIDEFDDFLQDEEELMMRGEEINSALDDFESDDISAILKDGVPGLNDSQRTTPKDNHTAEELNSMMDDFLDFDDEFYDEDNDK